jgi:hypothetical protein
MVLSFDKKFNIQYRKKMKRINTISVLGICVFASLLAACESTISELGSGEKITVHFSLGGVAYQQDEAITRSSGGEVAALATTSVPLKGGLYLDATLEADPDGSTRADIALEDNVKVRIIAYNGTGTTVAASVEYTVIDGALVPSSSTGITLNDGTYTFVAYSYNSSASPATSGILTVSQDIDLLYGRQTETISAANNTITLTMKHQFARVKVMVSSAEITGTPPLSEFSNVKILPGKIARLTIETGAIVKGTGTDPEQPVTNFTPASGTTVSSDYRTVNTAGNEVITIRIGSMKIGTTTYAERNVSFRKILAAGSSYVLKLTLKEARWAGSNIYWDGSQLTFKPAGYVGDENYYQGVYFKWGSLVGVSPVSTQFGTNPNPPVYLPTYDTNAETAAWASATNVNDYMTIIYVDDAYSGLGGREDTYLIDADRNTDTYYSARKGDICQFISKTTNDPALKNQYRMPKSIEFGGSDVEGTDYSYGTAANGSDIQGWYLGRYSPAITISDATGKQIIGGTGSGGFCIFQGAIFPASGYRTPTVGGSLSYQGQFGHYWSGSASSEIINGYKLVYELECDASSANPSETQRRDVGIPVRCIKNN